MKKIKSLIFRIKYGFWADHEMINQLQSTPKEQLEQWIEFCLFLPEDKERFYKVESNKSIDGEYYDYVVVNLKKHFDEHNYIYSSFEEYMSWISHYFPIKHWRQDGIFTNLILKDEFVRECNSGTIKFKYVPFWRRIYGAFF
jgi:hypothetical protein